MAGHALGFLENIFDVFDNVQGIHRSNLYGGANYAGTKHRRALIFDIFRDLHAYNRHLHAQFPLPAGYNHVDPAHFPLRRAADAPGYISRATAAFRPGANVVPDIEDLNELEGYIDNLPPIVGLAGPPMTNAQSKQWLIAHKVISPNLDRPTWSFQAIKLWYDNPIIRQLMFLLTISDTTPLLGVHFDEWFKEAFSDQDFILFGRPSILADPVALLPGGSAGAQLVQGGIYLPTISNLIRNMQNPDVISLYIYSVFLVARSLDATVQVRWIMRILTRRLNQANVESIYLYKGTDPSGSLTGTVSGSTSGGSSLNDIRFEVLVAMFQKFTGREDSNFILAEDRVTVLGIDFVFETINVPSALHHMPNNALPSQVKTRIREMLQHMQAYRLPSQLKATVDRLSLKHPSQHSNDCMIEAFTFMRMYMLGLIYENMPKKQQLDIYDALTRDWPKAQLREMNLYDCLRALLIYETEEWERHDQTGYVILNFFGGFHKPPACRSVRLTLSTTEEGYELDGEMPAGGAQVFENEGNHLELVYYMGHMLVCYHDQFVAMTQTQGSYSKRILNLSDQFVPEPFTLKPIDVVKGLEAKKRFQAKRARLTPALPNPLSKVQGCFCADTNQCKSSADLETGTCESCTQKHGRQVQEAFSCGLAWGTSVEESVCFNGQECLEAAKQATFDTYDGCITQMLRWLKKNWGFYYQERETQHAPCKVVDRVIYWFYGSRFDMFFVKDVLLFWNEPVTLMPMNGDLLKMSWGQYTFVDFARLYPGFNLDGCYETFKKVDIGEQVYLERKPSSKWKAFPYMALCSGVFDRGLLPIAMMSSNEMIWGGKKANPDDPRPTAEVNAEWWAAEIDPAGFDVHKHLADYCISDVLILQYCVIVHSLIMSKGEMNGRKYDLNQAITCSNMAMTLFRQCFLEAPIKSPDLKAIVVPWTDELSGQCLTFQACLQDAMKGGKTDCFRHSMYNESRMQTVKTWMAANPGRAQTVDDFDVNSMYPHIMESQLMPTEYQGMAVYNKQDESWEGIELDEQFEQVELFDQNLYWVDVQYPAGKSGILSKVCGFCVSLQHVPFCYQDPYRNDRYTYSMIFGRELRTARKLHAGIRIRVRLSFRFSGTPIFKNYINTLYSMRLASTSLMFKTFYKLMMNSTFGKLAQGLKPETTLMYNNFDLMCTEEDKVIVDVETIPGAQGKTLNMVSTLSPEKSYIGQLIYMAAYITAGARSLLEELIHDAQLCVNEQGLPCLLYYVDTDSIKICSVANVPENQWFVDKWVHARTLGKIKKEGTYDWIVMLGKKCGFFHEVEPSNQICTKAQLIESLHHSGLKSWHVKSKGVPSKIVDPAAMMEVYLTGDRHTFYLPDQLKRDLSKGISRTSGATRSMGFRNLARRPPTSDGELVPYADPAEFVAIMKERSVQEKLQGLIHLD